MLRRFERVNNSLRVVSFQPAVCGHRPVARSMGARVHHHYAIARLKQKLRLSQYAYSIVGDSMKDEHPIAVGIRGTKLPASQENAIGGVYVKILTMRADV
jgi:hypothetical protein